MMRQLPAAVALYFAIVFGVGFLLGPIRVFLLEPRLGATLAVLLEAPLLLIAMAATLLSPYGLDLHREVWAVARNPKPMALWAGLIAGFMALGIATVFVGLAFVFPLIGHATWHAYRSIVAGERSAH